MKIKKFNEKTNQNEPEVGDYIIVRHNIRSISEITTNNIGTLTKIIKDVSTIFPYVVKYNNAPDEFNTYSNNKKLFRFSMDEILYWSKDKEELELILKSNKFNI